MTPSKGIPSLSSNLVQFKPIKAWRYLRRFVLYIPIWYNSSTSIAKKDKAGSRPLHSNLVQFKPLSIKRLISFVLSLHSNLVQFKQRYKGGWKNAVSNFTFQSGTIQANVDDLFTEWEESFTFQSGTIQAPEGEGVRDKWKETLHSNLVQFKQCKEHCQGGSEELYIPIWYNSSICVHVGIATYSCLYIPIWYNSSYANYIWNNYIIKSLHSNLVQFKQSITCPDLSRKGSFTFQSGTIQAGDAIVPSPVKLLYIPIWYNSSHIPALNHQTMRHPLHSNLVQFKRLLPPAQSRRWSTLHSNLVQFKQTVDRLWKCKEWDFTFQSGTIQAYFRRGKPCLV